MKKLSILIKFLAVFIYSPAMLICTSPANIQKTKQRIILIGAGGKKGMEYFSILKNHVNFVGFIQPNPRQDLLSLAKKNSVHIYSNLEALCQEINFDGAIITVPHYLHMSYTKKLLKLGKFIIKEKPISITHDELKNYYELSAQKIPSLFTIVQRQFKPSFIQAKKDMKSIGKIYSFKYEYDLNLESTTGWRADKKLSGGGALLDMGYHAIDIITTFFGMPHDVSAQFAYKTEAMKLQELEDEAFILFSYSSGLMGNLIISRHGSEKKEFLEIAGEDGVMVITPSWYKIFDSKGMLIKTYAPDISKNKELLNMFIAYLNHVNDITYIGNEFSRHECNMKLIDQIYACK